MTGPVEPRPLLKANLQSRPVHTTFAGPYLALLHFLFLVDMKPYFALFSLLTFLFTACKNDVSKSQSVETATPILVSGPRYIRLTGTLGDQAVVLHLSSDNTVGDSKTSYAGQITWPDGSSAAVYGMPDASGQVVLEAAFHAQDSTVQYRIQKIMPGGIWTGVQENPAAPIELKETYPEGSLRFVAKEWQDSLKARPDIKDSPVCDLSQSVLVPNSGDPSTDAWLLQELLHAYGADSLAGKPANFDALFTALRKEMFEAYPTEIEDYDPQKEDQYSAMWSHSSATSMEILHNENYRLTIAVTNYVFTGGAHGNYGSSLHTYDLKAQKRLALGDLLKPGHEKALAPHLAAAARRWAGLDKTEALDTVFFVENNTIPLT